MDANLTRFHLLLGRDDWTSCTLPQGAPVFEEFIGQPPEFSWDGVNSAITLGTRINVFASAAGNQVPTLDQRRGGAQDRFGNFYWIGESRTELRVTSSGSTVSSHFWSSADELANDCGIPSSVSANTGFRPCAPHPPPAPMVFSGLAVTEQHYLVAGVLGTPGIVVFDLFHGGPPRQFAWPAEVPFVPFDMAPAPGGGVWILDRANGRVWALDQSFTVIPQDQQTMEIGVETPDVFAPVDGTLPPVRPVRTFPTGIALSQSSPIGSIDAIAIESLPDSTILLLVSDAAEPFSSLYRFRFGQQLGNPTSLASVLEVLSPDDRANFTLLSLDFAFIAAEQTPCGQRANTLYAVGSKGDQAWAFKTFFESEQLSFAPYAEFFPLRLFGGKGLVTGNRQVYYDSRDRWVPVVMQKRPRYAETAELISRVFDGKEPDCVWHRLMLDAAIPSDTRVVIFSRAHNDANVLTVSPWNLEPIPYRRGDGTELPWTLTPEGFDTWELLFQRAKGRYMQMRLVLSGSGKVTPRLRAARAYYPRFSYRDHYLPAVYRADATSASFVDRFLANTEGFFTAIEDRIATVQALFDPDSAPADALDWLANWFGVALDPSWTEAKRRLFIRNAARFFEARGTTPGLMMALRLAVEDCADQAIFDSTLNVRTGIRIVEKFRTRTFPVGLLQPPDAPSGLPVQQQTSAWTPGQGADDLDRRYQQALQLPVGSAYPAYLPPASSQYSQWKNFSVSTLGLVPARPQPTSDLWATFLRTRYSSIGALSVAYGFTYSAFSGVPFPASLPRKPQPLLDWYQFQGVLLIQATAHQFTVFLPLAPGDAQSTNAQRRKIDLAKRVTDLEKPAHTTYELKFYWAFFRIGEARLQEDTVLDRGSRSSQLLLPSVVGDTYIGSAFLSRELSGQPTHRPFLKRPLMQQGDAL